MILIYPVRHQHKRTVCSPNFCYELHTLKGITFLFRKSHLAPTHLERIRVERKDHGAKATKDEKRALQIWRQVKDVIFLTEQMRQKDDLPCSATVCLEAKQIIRIHSSSVSNLEIIRRKDTLTDPSKFRQCGPIFGTNP
jgi:hypothetical protein